MTLLSRSSAQAALSLSLIVAAAVLTLLGGLLAVFLIPLSLIAVLIGVPGSSGVAEIVAWLWFPISLPVFLYVAVTGLEVMSQPDRREVVKLALLTGAVFLTSPVIWWILRES